MKHTILMIMGVLIGGIIATGMTATGTYAQKLNIGEAIDNTMAMLESQPNDQFLRERLMKLHFVQGAHFLQARDETGASDSFMSAIRVAFESFGTISESDEVVVLARYGLAHAANDQGLTKRAVATLDEMLVTDPGNRLGLYMLGVVLMSSRGDSDFQRGTRVMHDLWDDSAIIGQFDISQSAAQLTYERALGLSEEGDVAEALDLLVELRATYGSNPSTVSSDNYNIRYALGWMAMETGDEKSAIAEFKGILSENPGFLLPDGTSIENTLASLQ